MAIRFGNPLLSTKLAVISTGVFLFAVILKQSAPLISDFAVTEVPAIYGSVISWLRPPYLYLVINCIIISIVATSKLQQNNRRQQKTLDYLSALSPETIPTLQTAKDVGSVDKPTEYLFVTDHTVADVRVVEEEKDARLLEIDGAYTTVAWRPPERSDSGELLVENEKEIAKPPVSARFGHKRSAKTSSSQGGKALRVSKPKRQDTLESTWRTITDGKAMPLTRHLKKSDTWNSRTRDVAISPVPPPRSKIKKSETVVDSTTITAEKEDNNGGRLRREPSPSQDELNRRVEAFIKKCNEEMRLQRQKSLDQYKQMISVTGY